LRVAQALAPENPKLVAEVAEWLGNPADHAGIRVREKLRLWVPEYLGRIKPEVPEPHAIRIGGDAQQVRQAAATLGKPAQR